MAIFCVNCGEELEKKKQKCPACQTPVSKMVYKEKIAVAANAKLKFPDICCCCLNERELTRRFGGVHLDVFDVPWCYSCRRTRFCYLVLESVIWTLLLLLLWGIGIALGSWLLVNFPIKFSACLDKWLGEKVVDMLQFILIYAVSLVVAMVLAENSVKGMEKALKRIFFRRSGHVFGCDAFKCYSGLKRKDRKKKQTILLFKNPVYAQKWRKINQREEEAN